MLIVPSGPLISLPFNVLVTEPPESGAASKFAAYRDAAWLGTRQPITILSSVASLKSLRQLAKASRASKPYLGTANQEMAMANSVCSSPCFWRAKAT